MNFHRKAGRIFGDEYRNIIICVDRIDGNLLSGSYYSLYLSCSRSFSCLFDLIYGVEGLFNEMGNVRSWREVKVSDDLALREIPDTASSVSMRGKIATFRIRITFRQNASWQGMITWIEGRDEESFRSTLDMSLFMRNKCRYAYENSIL